ncbi:MAG: hypothetical protein CM1200mP4_4600 [Rhodospirillaceae bacterium]|nr:MAG: hypothetical protein CM1200mP4_4600 [Rhodospirillaceae bacterium]
MPGHLIPLRRGFSRWPWGSNENNPFFSRGGKTYEFVVQWGEARDTDDAEGAMIRRSKVRPKEREYGLLWLVFRERFFSAPPIILLLK